MHYEEAVAAANAWVKMIYESALVEDGMRIYGPCEACENFALRLPAVIRQGTVEAILRKHIRTCKPLRRQLGLF